MSLTIVLYLDVLVATSDASAPIDRRASEVYLEAPRYTEAEVLLHKIGVLTYFLYWFLVLREFDSHRAKAVNLMFLNVKLLVNASNDISRKISYRLTLCTISCLRHLNIIHIDILDTANFLL